MKKRLPTFVAGMLTMALIGGLGFSALAAAGSVTFNASNLTLNGTQISAKGENYILANGQSVPASITYTDEKGGGTTYLPVRRISELLGVETGWDGATGSVTVKGEPKAPPSPETPAIDYSDWSAEDEAAYQEFKGLWEVTIQNTENSMAIADVKESVNYVDFISYLKDTTAEKISSYANRLIFETNQLYPTASDRLYFLFSTYGIVTWAGDYWTKTNTVDNNYNMKRIVDGIEQFMQK